MGHVDGVCTENLKKEKEIQDRNTEIKCGKFVAKRYGWSIKDFHEWKDRHITMKRNFWIATASLVISIFAVLLIVVCILVLLE